MPFSNNISHAITSPSIRSLSNVSDNKKYFNALQ